jgi:hypothetical protein
MNAYSTGVGWFTVITTSTVYRVKASSEAHLRDAFSQVGIPVLAVERDADAA